MEIGDAVEGPSMEVGETIEVHGVRYEVVPCDHPADCGYVHWRRIGPDANAAGDPPETAKRPGPEAAR